MKRRCFMVCYLLVFLFVGVSPTMAETPTLEQQLVYALEVYDGVGYTSNFAPANEETIYLLADHSNAFSPRNTMVYYWAITRSYKADWDELNEPVESATLEILQGQTLIQELPPTLFSIVLPEGHGSRKSYLLWGADAERGYPGFLEEFREYYIQIRDYQNAYQEYQTAYDEYQDAMLDETIVEKPNAPVRPVEPPPFLKVVIPPSFGFQVNLPEGDYRIRLKDLDGQIIPDSEKKIVVFSHRRTGIGYKIIPESRWTVPERSDDPQQTIYVMGGSNAAIYLQPFYEAEYNEAYYRGLLDTQDHSGAADRWAWAHMEPFYQATMTMSSENSTGELEMTGEKPFFVVQMPGPRLGYQVVEYDPATMGGQRPTFVGFEVGLERDDRKVTIGLVDQDGVVVEGSEREIRWVPEKRPVIQYLWLSFPLLVGLIVFVLRRSRTKRS
ncbi:MAG TPA: hypothetical protein G4O14_01320 [Anaerolineae bacterium]|nr:hypothetical protein [Anaerolineae bacterium]